MTLSLSDPETGAERQLNVTVPQALRDGQSFRLKGQAGSGGRGGPPGDLYVDLRIIPHPHFRVDGDDVHSDIKVSPWEAVLGASVPVDTLGGRIMLKIPPRSHNGTRLRVTGRGLPGTRQGDHYVTLSVDVPQTLTDEELRHFEALAETSRFDPRHAA